MTRRGSFVAPSVARAVGRSQETNSLPRRRPPSMLALGVASSPTR
ncbi:hypothetical protein Ae706Ps2_1266c [Pseudonocardia sp. Ae706_Ps2]|nr:hypothetical protein Ae706Ps2_1266c [Pseudonocardia sp. Ae706_Ps2]